MERQAARTDCLQKLFAGGCRQNKIRIRRDFFEGLEESVCRGIVHAVGFRDNHYADAVALHREGCSHRADEFHRNKGPGTENIDAVRVLCNFFDVRLLKVLNCLRGAPGRDVSCVAGTCLFCFHRHDPVVRDARIRGHLAAEAFAARADARVCTLQRLSNFHRQRLLANAYRAVDENRLREPVLAQRRHEADADSFLGGWAI